MSATGIKMEDNWISVVLSVIDLVAYSLQALEINPSFYRLSQLIRSLYCHCFKIWLTIVCCKDPQGNLFLTWPARGLHLIDKPAFLLPVPDTVDKNCPQYQPL